MILKRIYGEGTLFIVRSLLPEKTEMFKTRKNLDGQMVLE